MAMQRPWGRRCLEGWRNSEVSVSGAKWGRAEWEVMLKRFREGAITQGLVRLCKDFGWVKFSICLTLLSLSRKSRIINELALEGGHKEEVKKGIMLKVVEGTQKYWVDERQGVLVLPLFLVPGWGYYMESLQGQTEHLFCLFFLLACYSQTWYSLRGHRVRPPSILTE